jgi:hypothetical protein
LVGKWKPELSDIHPIGERPRNSRTLEVGGVRSGVKIRRSATKIVFFSSRIEFRVAFGAYQKRRERLAEIGRRLPAADNLRL